MDYDIRENRVFINSDFHSKKLTATKLGSILGLNPWDSAFSAWCDMTKVRTKPFVSTPQTVAGKIIEGIIIKWCKEKIGENVMSPEEFYGNLWPTVSRGYDFYKDDNIFGGMWDAKAVNKKRETLAVVEVKTTGRPNDWLEGVPLEKLVQALMYGAKENAKTTYVVVAFLKESDYAYPDHFVPDDSENGGNVKLYSFNTTDPLTINGKSYNIYELMHIAVNWYKEHIVTGISPVYDEKQDKEILDDLRKNRPDAVEDANELSIVKDVNELTLQIDALYESTGIKTLEKELGNKLDSLKRLMQSKLEANGLLDKYVCANYELAKTVRNSVDSEKLKADGVYDKYNKETTCFTLRKKKEN